MTGMADNVGARDVARRISARPTFRPRDLNRAAARTAGLLLLTGGGAAFLIRLLDLQPVVTGATPAIALCFALSGLSLWLHAGGVARGVPLVLRMAAAAAVLALGLLSVLQYGIGAGSSVVSGMSVAAAAGFALLGAALLCLESGVSRVRQAALLLTLLLAALSFFELVAYLYGAAALGREAAHSWPALPDALLLGAAAIGLTARQVGSRPLDMPVWTGSGTRIARRLLPFAVVAPVLIGWLTLQVAADARAIAAMIALLVTASVLALAGLSWKTAVAVSRADRARQQAGAAANQDLVRHAILFQKARDGMVVFDEHRNICETNASFVSMLGCLPHEVMSQHPWDWDVNAPSEEEFVAAWPAMPETSGRIETQFRRKSGEIIDVEITYTPTVLGGGRYLYCSYRDVTARKNAERSLRDSEERFRRALANIPDVVVMYDCELRIRYINNATRAITGMPASDLIGRRDYEVLPPEVCDAYLPTLREALETKLIRKVETEITLPRGGTRALRITCVPLIDRSGDVREVLGITHDFTDRKRAESAIRESEARYRELVEQAPDGIFICDSEGVLMLANTRCCELLGYTPEELVKKQGAELFSEEDADLIASRTAVLSSGKGLRYERMMKRKDGSTFPAEVSIKMLESGRMQVLFHDITARRRQERKIARLSRIHSVLSGINSAIVRHRNRQDLFGETCRIAVEAGEFKLAWIGRNDPATGRLEMLAQAGLPARSGDEGIAVGAAVDLMPDGPARFALQEKRPVYDNDISRSLHLSKMRRMAIRVGAKAVIALPLTVDGGVFGLLVLYAAAATDEQATVARIGPDTFAIATSCSWEAAETVHALEQLNERVFREPLVLNEEVLRVSATSGVALFPADGRDAHALVSNAEASLRDAKNRNLRHLLYSPEINEKVADLVRLENRLRLALKHDEILMWYQPKISVRGRELTGFEALMRWHDGQSGQIVQPSEFIPVMEQTGLILEAGERVLETVAADCEGWAAADLKVKRIAVNVSLLQVRDGNFVEAIVAAQNLVRNVGVELELELTESVIMEDPDSIVPKLQALRDLGVLIAVDDFGTGYSSLAYIARLPIHALKVDRSFVAGMAGDESSLAIVKSIISLAHSLGLTVIAEGVESAAQADLLEQLNCDEMQGYLLSPPVAPENVPVLAGRFDRST
jgi:PAS domain S-box-containing protein